METEVTEPTLLEDATEFYSEPETAQPETVEKLDQEKEGAAEQEAESIESDASENQDSQEIDLSVIARALGLEDDDLDVDENGQAVIKAKIDGVESKAKVKDFLATYQKQGHLDNKLRDYTQREAQFKEQQANFQAQAQAQVRQYKALNQIALNELYNDAKNVDWNELRQVDPGEFAARQSEFRTREANIQNAITQLDEQQKAFKYQQLATEAEKMLTLIPEWSNPDIAEKEKAEISEYLRKNKMNPEITNYSDVILILKKAKAYDELNSSQPEIKKLVKAAPKVSKQRAPINKGAPKTDADYFY